MANGVVIPVKLDLKPFSAGLKSALKMGTSFRKQFVNIAAGLQVKVDETQFKREIKNLEKIYRDFDRRAESQKTQLKADSKQAVKEAARAEQAVEKVPKSRTTTLKTSGTKQMIANLGQVTLAAAGVVAAFRGIMRVGGNLIKASNKQEDAEQSLKASLSATGIESEITSKKLFQYATSIQKLTRYGDEAIIGGLALGQNIGHMAEQDLPKAEKAAVGLAARFKVDLNTAFMLIGRAAQGQTSLLTRYGIQLDKTATKEEQFQQLLQIGAAGFQIATDEAKSGAGALEQYSNIVGDFKENLGKMLKTALMPFVKVGRDLFTYLNENQGVLKGLVVTISAVATGLAVAKLATIQWNTALLANPITAIVAGIVALGAALSIGVQKIGGWSAAWKYAKASVQIAWEYVKAFWGFLKNGVKTVAAVLVAPWTVMWETVKSVFTNIRNIWKMILSGDFKGAWEAAKSGLVTGFNEAIANVKKQAETLSDPFIGLAQKSKEIWAAAATASKEYSQQQQQTFAISQSGVQANIKNIRTLKSEYIAAQQQMIETDRSVAAERVNLLAQWIQTYREAITISMNIMQGWASFAQQQRQQKAARDQEILQQEVNQRKSALQKELEQGKISQAAYDKKIQYINAQEEIRTKQLDRESKKRSLIEKTTAISQTLIATYEMASKAYKAMAGIPVVGPALGIAASAAAMALGMAKVAAIQRTPAYELGGLVGGGKKMIQVNEKGEEFVLNARATRIIGPELLAKAMSAPLAAKQALLKLTGPIQGVPQPAFAFQSGGSTAVASVFSSRGIEQRLDGVESRIAEVVDAIRALTLRADISPEELSIIVEKGDRIIQGRNV